MWWNMLSGAIAGWFGNEATRAQADANNRISAVNAESSNKVRVAGNAATAAKNTLDRWIQSVNNNKALDEGGRALEANTVNARRQGDAGMQQDFASSIRSAEQEGHAAAAAAASGIDGSVVDMVNGSTALRDSIVRQSISDARDMQAYDTARRAGIVMSQTINGMDNSIILDNLDYNQNYAQITPKISAWAAATRGAAPYAADALGSSMNGKDKAGGAEYSPATTQRIAARNSDGWRDNGSYEKGTRFSWDSADGGTKSTDASSPYQLWDGNASLSINDKSNDRDQYALWSR